MDFKSVQCPKCKPEPKPGSVIRVPKDYIPLHTPKCKHQNLVIFEQKAGKIVLGKDLSHIIDWSSNVINAHYLRVTKYYCPDCKEIIPAPTDAKDER